MTHRERTLLRWLGLITAVACALQLYGLIRYVNRLPDDWTGITLYAITAVALAIVSLGAFLRAQNAR